MASGSAMLRESIDDGGQRRCEDGASLPMVLHVRVVTGAGGGPDKTILNSPRFLGPLGYRCTCAFLRPADDAGFERLRRRAAVWQAPIAEIIDRGPWDLDLVARATALARELNVRVWHAHDYKSNLLGLLVRRRWPMALVTTCHGWVERTWRTILYHQVDRLTLRRYDHVIAVSADIEAACRRLGVPPSKLSLIENAIDTEQFARTRMPVEAKPDLDWPRQRHLIGAVGRLSPEKGFDLLVRAIARLVAAGRDVGAIIAGEGAEHHALDALIAELNLSGRVRLAGFQERLAPLYEAMDVYALSSRREGLPNVVLEAMAFQTPVVATRVAGVPNLIEDGVNGLLTPLEDVDALAAAVARILDDRQLSERLARAARQTVVERFSFSRRMAKVAAIYDSVLHSRGAV